MKSTLYLIALLSAFQLLGQPAIDIKMLLLKDASKKTNAKDSLTFTRSSSFLIDGGIRDVTSKSIDQSANGMLGFRRNSLFTRFDLTIASVSTMTPIKSDKVEDYARSILNPYNTQSGAAVNFSFTRRHFSRRGEIISRLLMLYNKEALTKGNYDQILDRNNLDETSQIHSAFRLGGAVDFQVSNFVWEDPNILLPICQTTLGSFLVNKFRSLQSSSMLECG